MAAADEVLDALGDPVRRRIVEVLAAADRNAGDVVRIVGGEFGISQPAVSRHLRVLRAAGAVHAQADGARRVYRLDGRVIDELGTVVDRYRSLWSQRLDALDTEIARGRAGREGSGRDGDDRDDRDLGAGADVR